MPDVLLEVAENGVAVITLNRPEARNAMSANLSRELRECVAECEARDDVRCMVLTGAGKCVDRPAPLPRRSRPSRATRLGRKVPPSSPLSLAGPPPPPHPPHPVSCTLFTASAWRQGLLRRDRPQGVRLAEEGRRRPPRQPRRPLRPGQGQPRHPGRGAHEAADRSGQRPFRHRRLGAGAGLRFPHRVDGGILRGHTRQGRGDAGRWAHRAAAAVHRPVSAAALPVALPPVSTKLLRPRPGPGRSR